MGAASSRAAAAATKASACAVAQPTPAPICPPSPTITLELTDQKDYYVLGDVVCGFLNLEFYADVVVTSLETSLGFTQRNRILAEPITCANLRKDHVQPPTSFAAGHHCIPFSHAFVNMVRTLPPSFAFPNKPDTGVSWHVLCYLEIDDHEYSAYHTITFRGFVPRPPYFRQGSFTVGAACAGLGLEIICPCEIPQGPDLCPIIINAQANTPIVLNRISIYLAGRVATWGNTDASTNNAVTDTFRELIGNFAQPQLVTGAVRLDAELLDCWLRRFYPQAFATAHMCLTYWLVFEVQTHTVDSFKFTDIWLAGPRSAKSEHVLASDDGTLPPYTET